ncbi:MAG: SDR family oxidoreductase [Dokdonella sp.]
MNASRWRLDGQLALLTGASKGIGFATARELLGLGADVLLVARDEIHLQQARDDLAEEFPQRSVRAFAADVTQAEQRLQVFDWIADLEASVSVLINNVGSNLRKKTLDYSENEFRGILETNLISAFEMSRLGHAHLRQHGNASIVNVGSVSGERHVRTGSPYGMSKAALHQLTRNLACEWAEDGIRVNAVAPWYIRTRRSEPALADADYFEEVIARTPMARIGEIEEVGAAIAFLCLPAASYITGQCLGVDGGFLAHGF